MYKNTHSTESVINPKTNCACPTVLGFQTRLLTGSFRCAVGYRTLRNGRLFAFRRHDCALGVGGNCKKKTAQPILGFCDFIAIARCGRNARVLQHRWRWIRDTGYDCRARRIRDICELRSVLDVIRNPSTQLRSYSSQVGQTHNLLRLIC